MVYRRTEEWKKDKNGDDFGGGQKTAIISLLILL
jgi:hypothetical protein